MIFMLNINNDKDDEDSNAFTMTRSMMLQNDYNNNKE